MTVVVSTVSHGHGSMLKGLVERLAQFEEVSQILLTINIPETLNFSPSDKLKFIINDSPKGFGANHNQAFQQCKADYFCVLNPDIEFTENPFPHLLANLRSSAVGIVAPVVLNAQGGVEDSARKFPTFWTMAKRLLGFSDGYSYGFGSGEFSPDWVAGMFMLFPSKSFADIHGFDESYYMYCEDIDICRRTWQAERSVVVNPKISVVHKAQRASHRSLRHLRWHLHSLYTFLSKPAFRKTG